MPQELSSLVEFVVDSVGLTVSLVVFVVLVVLNIIALGYLVITSPRFKDDK